MRCPSEAADLSVRASSPFASECTTPRLRPPDPAATTRSAAAHGPRRTAWTGSRSSPGCTRSACRSKRRRRTGQPAHLGTQRRDRARRSLPVLRPASRDTSIRHLPASHTLRSSSSSHRRLWRSCSDTARAAPDTCAAAILRARMGVLLPDATAQRLAAHLRELRGNERAPPGRRAPQRLEVHRLVGVRLQVHARKIAPGADGTPAGFARQRRHGRELTGERRSQTATSGYSARNCSSGAPPDPTRLTSAAGWRVTKASRPRRDPSRGRPLLISMALRRCASSTT